VARTRCGDKFLSPFVAKQSALLSRDVALTLEAPFQISAMMKSTICDIACDRVFENSYQKWVCQKLNKFSEISAKSSCSNGRHFSDEKTLETVKPSHHTSCF